MYSADIYDADFLKTLFDEMQGSYERVCTATSFGFNRRWRKQIVNVLGLDEGMKVCDFMAGGGESWMYVLPRIGRCGRLVAVDFSSNTVRSAQQRSQRLPQYAITVLEEDALASSVGSESADAVLCVFGVKTLTCCAQERFVGEIRRVLRPGGVFGLVEVSVPPHVWLRVPYMFYLSRVVPQVGRLLLGNPDNYRMLGCYVAGFGDCRALAGRFAAQGFNVRFLSLFGGCATGVVGVKAASC